MKFARVIIAAGLLGAWLFLFVGSARASATVEIVCDNNRCTPATIGSLFSPSTILWAPGTQQSSTLRVTNSSPTSHLMLAAVFEPIKSSLSTCNIERYMQLTAARSDGKVVMHTTAPGVLSRPIRASLGEIQPKTTHLYTFTLKMSEATPNECQGVTGTFDIQLDLQQAAATKNAQEVGGGQVLGAQSTRMQPNTAGTLPLPQMCRSCVWWPFYLLQIGAYLLFVGYAKRGGRRVSVWWTPGIAIAANVLFLLFHSLCIERWGALWYVWSDTNPLCPLMAFWSLILLLCFLISWHGFVKTRALNE